MAKKRKSLSKKLRFEVFKRDSFRCQYCGRSAPEVVLQVDHIIPVAKGGTDELMNLITSCDDCNQGKGAVPLDSRDMLLKQKAELDKLNEKHEQMKMMLEWKQELLNMAEQQIDSVNDLIQSITGYRVNDVGKRHLRKQIARFGYVEVYDATEIAFAQYYDDRKESTSFAKALDSIGGICYNRKRSRENGNV